MANVAGVAGNSITFTGDGIKTITVLAGENAFTVTSGDATQILEDGDVITLSGGADIVMGTSAANAELSAAMTSNAAAGNTVFTVSLSTSFESANLRLQGIHLDTYLAGAIQELAEQGIYSMYVSLALNTSDTSVTSIDFNFTL